MRLFRQEAGEPETLATLGVESVLEAALARFGLVAVAYGDGVRKRVWGKPGNLDPYAITDVFLDDGAFVFDALVPVAVPVERRAAAVELCLLLSSVGRIAFTLDDQGYPRARLPFRLVGEVAAETAVEIVAGTLEVLGGRCPAAELAFRAVAKGTDPVSALAQVPRERLPVPRLPWSEPPLTPGRTSTAARFSTSPGLQDCCPGPLVAHVDGLVECRACREPDTHEHLSDATAECSAEFRFANGHECERCRPREDHGHR